VLCAHTVEVRQTVHPVSDVLFNGSGHHFRDSDARDSIVSKEQRNHDDLVSLIDPVLSMEEFGVKISNVRGSHEKVQNLYCGDKDPTASDGRARTEKAKSETLNDAMSTSTLDPTSPALCKHANDQGQKMSIPTTRRITSSSEIRQLHFPSSPDNFRLEQHP
jgi:hypothetical protein